MTRTRLERLYPVLTFDERVAMALDAYHAGERVPLIALVTMPPSDQKKWLRFSSLLSTTHTQVGWYVQYVEARVEQVLLRVGILLCVSDLPEAGKLAESIAADASGLWRDVVLAERVADCLRERYGHEVVHPDDRETLTTCRGALLHARERLRDWDEFDFPEPSEDETDRLLDLLGSGAAA